VCCVGGRKLNHRINTKNIFYLGISNGNFLTLSIINITLAQKI
jgi:hypothetical protein